MSRPKAPRRSRSATNAGTWASGTGCAIVVSAMRSRVAAQSSLKLNAAGAPRPGRSGPP